MKEFKQFIIELNDNIPLLRPDLGKDSVGLFLKREISYAYNQRIPVISAYERYCSMCHRLQITAKPIVDFVNKAKLLGIEVFGEPHNCFNFVKFSNSELDESTISEVSAPGEESWIMKRKSEFKKRYGDNWKRVLYATAWKRHKHKKLNKK